MKPNTHAVRRSSSRIVPVWGAIVILVCTLVFTAVFLLTTWVSSERQIAAIHARNPAFDLELTTPNADAQALAATQQAVMQGYGWVDRNTHIARIPIARAMELIVTRSQQTSTPP